MINEIRIIEEFGSYILFENNERILTEPINEDDPLESLQTLVSNYVALYNN